MNKEYQSELRDVIKEITKTSRIVERDMRQYIKMHMEECNCAFSMIDYSLKDIGLRVRPFLLRNTHEINGGDFSDILPIAIATELMQISTLVIDDVLDESPMRNNRPSIAEKWGYKNAILVGECLKSLASICLIEAIKNIEAESREKITKTFEKTYLHVCIGQMEDLVLENNWEVDEKRYLNMIDKTTVKFIRAPIEIGVILNKFEPEVERCLDSYGINIGYAYQIRDDIIDLIGEPELTGKPFAGDIKQHKPRLPLIHFLSNANKIQKATVQSILRRSEIDDKNASTIVEMLHDCGSIEYCIDKCKEYCEAAIRNISPLPACRQKDFFIDLANLISRFDA